jgi:hypothetical protein
MIFYYILELRKTWSFNTKKEHISTAFENKALKKMVGNLEETEGWKVNNEGISNYNSPSNILYW